MGNITIGSWNFGCCKYGKLYFVNWIESNSNCKSSQYTYRPIVYFVFNFPIDLFKGNIQSNFTDFFFLKNLFTIFPSLSKHHSQHHWKKKRIQTNREEKMENIFLASGQFNINLCFKFIILLRKLFGRNSG